MEQFSVKETEKLPLPWNNVHVIFLVINQLDAQNFCFTIILFHVSTCFEHYCAHDQRSKLYYTASGIITPVCAPDGHLQVWWYQNNEVTQEVMLMMQHLSCRMTVTPRCCISLFVRGTTIFFCEYFFLGVGLLAIHMMLWMQYQN